MYCIIQRNLMVYFLGIPWGFLGFSILNHTPIYTPTSMFTHTHPLVTPPLHQDYYKWMA